MSTLDELAQHQIFCAEMFFLSQTDPTETFSWSLIAEDAAGERYVWELEWDRATRNELYDIMERELHHHGIVRYAIASEYWLSGDASDREEGFIIACADRSNNRLTNLFKLNRDEAGRATMVPYPGSPHAGLTGDMYTLLGFHCRDTMVVKRAAG